MIRYIAIAATALSIATTTSASAAGTPITTLGECYTAVINSCIATYPEHADECGSSSGLNDCDEEFGNRASTGINSFAPVRNGPAISPRTFRRLMDGAAAVRASR